MKTETQPSRDYAPHTLRAALHKGRMNRRAWLVTALLVLFQIINFADKAVLGLVAQPAMEELQLSASEFGFIGSAFFFLFALAAVAVGFLAGKVSTRWIILVMGVSWAVLQFPILFGGGAAILLVTRIILGAAEGPATPISLSHVQGWFEAKERGLPSSLVAAGSTLGPIIAAPVLAWIIAHPDLGWRWAFGVLGIVGLLWSAAWLLWGKDGPHSHLTQHGQSRGDISSREAQSNSVSEDVDVNGSGSIVEEADGLKRIPIVRVLGTRMFLVAVLSGAGCFWAQGFLTTWSPRYLGAVVELSPEMIGVVSTFPWLLGAATLLVLGYASRFLMRRGVSVRWAIGALFGATLLISGVSFLVLPQLSGPLAVATVTVAAGTAMIYPLAPTAIAFSVAPRQRAALMATLTGLASLGGVISPAMVGILMDQSGFVTPAPGQPMSPGMVQALASGMNSAFWMIGLYLVVVGILGMLLLNPDRTGRRLQRFAYLG